MLFNFHEFVGYLKVVLLLNFNFNQWWYDETEGVTPIFLYSLFCMIIIWQGGVSIFVLNIMKTQNYLILIIAKQNIIKSTISCCNLWRLQVSLFNIVYTNMEYSLITFTYCTIKFILKLIGSFLKNMSLGEQNSIINSYKLLFENWIVNLPYVIWISKLISKEENYAEFLSGLKCH